MREKHVGLGLRGRIIGGFHHGKRKVESEGVTTLALWRPLPVPEDPTADVALTAKAPAADMYRLAQFHESGRVHEVWVPADVERGRELEHVIKMAARPHLE